ncbi:Mitochondrial beta-keto-acyl synthase [Didymosphaeria variabile]|uniref:Mitochondrial beta-keto-acyl synthase n=1 Tax=Didymosphaeria variabile TaxID=1932322 RepID=A0A9W8XP99_9PLEO|nr:Mitochondrial beta-keto-acyl synthase [Didymosphaeria variabile]KAJ4355712.1 Mitochondrial beta-keto-acyl synthase [Didymosphaeria variabile]
MPPMATSGCVRIHGLDGGVDPQVNHTQRKSQLVPTTPNSRLGLHGYYRDVLGLPNNFNTLRSQSEHPQEYNESEFKQHYIDVEESDTGDKVLKHANRPTNLSLIGPASPMLRPQQLNDSKRQVSALYRSEDARKTTIFQSQHPPDRWLHAPGKSNFAQYNAYLDNEKPLGQQHVSCCNHENIPDLDYCLTPNQVHVNASSFELVPAPGRELEPNFGFKSSPEMTLPSDPDAVYEKSVCSDPANIEALQTSPPEKPSPRRATRSEPGSSHSRRRRAKVRAQYLRERSCRSASVPIEQSTVASAGSFPVLTSEELRPKRKHCTFVQEQELKCLFEDRVGTPHLSERQPGDDVNAQLDVDELSVGGEVAALSIEDEATQGLTAFAITDIPDEELSLS